MKRTPEASRLTSVAGAPVSEKVGPVLLRRLRGKVLATNDWGASALLSDEDFRDYLGGTLRAGDPVWEDLKSKGFSRQHLDFQALARRGAEKHLLRWPGPNVHTVVVTLRCNQRCVYCHSSVVGVEDVSKDMTLETARRVVDFIFSTPNPELMLEFQGGEPLLNWPAVRFIVEYARRRAEREGRSLHLGLISNFTLLDDEKVDHLARHKVSFCTSLDGPEKLHNKNRLYLGGNAHASAVAWLRELQKRRAEGLPMDPPNAIATVTRFSLDYPEAIVDQAIELGLERVQLGPLDPIGFARKAWGVVGYEPGEFVRFYRRALERIIERGRQGAAVYEKMALIFLIRILENGHWRFPNGDGLCRLAYNHDGGIYVSEEGRLLANEGEDFFRIGTAGETHYNDILEHPVLRADALAANPYAQPLCGQCAYQPYCTVVPVQNFQTQGTLWGRMPDNYWCRSLMGIFDLLFEKLDDPRSRPVLESWVERFRSR